MIKISFHSSVILAAICALFLPLSAINAQSSSGAKPTASSAAPAAPQRLRPPDAIKCDRNNLTSYTGKVLRYRVKENNSVVIRILNDDGTKKRFVVPYTKAPQELFLYRSGQFSDNNWKDIESAKDTIKTNMRATVWVCNDGSTLIDWQPPAE